MDHYNDRNGYKNILLPINRMLSVIVIFVKYKTSTMLQPAYFNTMFQIQRNVYLFFIFWFQAEITFFFFSNLIHNIYVFCNILMLIFFNEYM